MYRITQTNGSVDKFSNIRETVIQFSGMAKFDT